MRHFACIILSVLAVSAVQGQTDFLAVQKRIQELFNQYQGSVVRVKAYHTEIESVGAEVPEPIIRIGTGFFISREGLILVNANRVKGAKRVAIEHNGTDYLAEIIGMDEQVNLALLKALYLPDQFDFIRMNESPALPEPGTLALAITCPLTFSPSPRMTMVSGHDTKFANILFPTTYIRVDTPLHRGEGGAPLIDLQGRLVGMLLASLPEMQSSFVLPAGAINKIKDDLLLEGRASYASIGIEVGQHFIRGGRSRVKILDVVEGSPAENAGIIKGDIVLQVGDYPITDFSDFPNAMFFIRVGEYVDIEIERESERIAFNLPTIRRPDEDRKVKYKAITEDEAKQALKESDNPESNENSPGGDASPSQSEPVSANPEAAVESASINIPLSPQKEVKGPEPENER